MSLAPRTSARETRDPSQHVPLAPSNFAGDAAKDGVRLTAKAIQMAKHALVKRGTPGAALRLGVRGGGCSGVSYAIEFSDKIRERDNQYDFDGLRVVVDPKSLVYLRGSVLDYEIQLMQHGFKFQNPNEKSSCGCGESFTV
jgi:iron-sulfur cluster assembly protein